MKWALPVTEPPLTINPKSLSSARALGDNNYVGLQWISFSVKLNKLQRDWKVVDNDPKETNNDLIQHEMEVFSMPEMEVFNMASLAQSPTKVRN